MLQDGGAIAAAWGYPVEVVYVIFKACLGVALWGMAFVGFWLRPMAIWERVAAFAAGLLLVLALPWTDELGFLLSALLLGLHWYRARGGSAEPPHKLVEE